MHLIPILNRLAIDRADLPALTKKLRYERPADKTPAGRYNGHVIIDDSLPPTSSSVSPALV
jgi:hypothetical protein